MTTLSLFSSSSAPRFVLDGEWRLKAAHEGQGAEQGYADPSFDDSDWESVRLPHLRHATAEQDTLWYRHTFAARTAPFDFVGTAPTALRVLLRFGGAFYRTRVWLNGVDLGNHEGYFQPFGFDVTELLKPEGNLIAVRCRFPVEAGEFKRKTAVAGIFTDWDCKPYPSALYPNLPAPNEWTVPVGLWQPVSLQTAGPVITESFVVLATASGLDWDRGAADLAELKIKAVLRNLTSEAHETQASIDITPHNSEGAGQIANTCLAAGAGLPNMALAAGERREVECTLTIPQPRLWFPWTHGRPHLYRARLSLSASQLQTTNYDLLFGVRNIHAAIEAGKWEWSLNGRRVFPKGSNYVSDFYLDRVTEDGLRRDLELAREANLDLLRVHAHIAPLDFYRLCDELGVMVMSDFPLIWVYAFNLPPEEDAAFRGTVRAQVEDMVRLLGSHPSIVLWSMHNEPPWTPDGSFLGRDVHESATNQLMDEESAAIARALDPARPVIPASGIYDQHLYHGWYIGAWIDNRDLHPSFPTEFGVQALPNLESPFWATVNSNWPVDADDVSWAHSGYQSAFWAAPGVGHPAQYASLAEYVTESQAYQAFFIRYCIDQWRRQKFNPTGGYIHFLFTDGWPAITWSVLDYFRLPKEGYRALAEASRPARVCFDLEGGFSVERGFRIVFAEGSVLKLGLWVVNDDYRLAGEAEVCWWIEDRGGGLVSRLRRALRWMSAKRFPARLPQADEGATVAARIDVPLKRSGYYAFVTQLRLGNRVLDENRLSFRVGEPKAHHKPRRRVPGLFVNKVYDYGSLRHTSDGFTFSLRNPAMPVLLHRLIELRVDGQALDPAQVELVRGGVARRASSVSPQAPFEIPSGEPFAVVARGHRLEAGLHELEFVAEFVGLGEIAARVRDKLI